MTIPLNSPQPNYTMYLDDVLKEYEIFDFEYSFIDESTKAKFEEEFTERYRFNEIGFETVERFKHFLKVEVKRHCEHYSRLYAPYNAQIDILKTFNLKTNQTSSQEANQKETIFDTPTNDSVSNPKDEYASQINKRDDGNSFEGETTIQGFQDITEIELINKYSKMLRDIMDEFVEKFRVLFFALF